MKELTFQKDFDAYRAVWEGLNPEIDENIEKNRKADFCVTVCDAQGNVVPEAEVTFTQTTHAFDFGTNALLLGSLPEEVERAYEQGIVKLFNLITTTLCWGATEYEAGKYRFEEGVADMFRRPPIARALKFAKENGLRLKGQPLMADSWVPAWAASEPEALKRQQASFFQKAAEYLKGDIDVVDVHNEAFCAPGRSPRYPLWDEDCTFVDWAFESVQGLFPRHVDTELNEATPVNDNDDWIARYEGLAKRLLDKRLPIRSLGIQFHMFNREQAMEHVRGRHLNVEKIYATYKRYCQLGIPLYISEVTIPSNFEGSRQQGEAVQAEILRNLYRLWFSIPNMKGIIYWNLKDGPAWKNEGDCRGCLLDENGWEKPSYQALYQLIKREWTTQAHCETNAQGEASVRGFKGGYTVVVKKNGKQTSASVQIGRANRLTLRLE